MVKIFKLNKELVIDKKDYNSFIQSILCLNEKETLSLIQTPNTKIIININKNNNDFIIKFRHNTLIYTTLPPTIKLSFNHGEKAITVNITHKLPESTGMIIFYCIIWPIIGSIFFSYPSFTSLFKDYFTLLFVMITFYTIWFIYYFLKVKEIIKLKIEPILIKHETNTPSKH